MIRDYFDLCKPRVVLLMILTSLAGMCLAPGTLTLSILIWGNLGIALVAFSAAAFNHLADQHMDKIMRRTQHRPLVQGKITPKNATLFAIGLCLLGMAILFYFINTLTALLTFASLVGYAICYTLYLKHTTPQNIVIGGIAGAIPPLLGWTAVTNTIDANALLLVLIVYVWTPPHFWALAIYRLEDYAKANIPMLPHTHSVAYTKLNILLYTILLTCVSSLPYFVRMSHTLYIIGISLANIIFLLYALRLFFKPEKIYALKTFHYSIYYLGFLFLLLLIDHYY